VKLKKKIDFLHVSDWLTSKSRKSQKFRFMYTYADFFAGCKIIFEFPKNIQVQTNKMSHLFFAICKNSCNFPVCEPILMNYTAFISYQLQISAKELAWWTLTHFGFLTINLKKMVFYCLSPLWPIPNLMQKELTG